MMGQTMFGILKSYWPSDIFNEYEKGLLYKCLRIRSSAFHLHRTEFSIQDFNALHSQCGWECDTGSPFQS